MSRTFLFAGAMAGTLSCWRSQRASAQSPRPPPPAARVPPESLAPLRSRVCRGACPSASSVHPPQLRGEEARRGGPSHRGACGGHARGGPGHFSSGWGSRHPRRLRRGRRKGTERRVGRRRCVVVLASRSPEDASDATRVEYSRSARGAELDGRDQRCGNRTADKKQAMWLNDLHELGCSLGRKRLSWIFLYCVLAYTLMSNYDFTLIFVIVVILSLLCNY